MDFDKLKKIDENEIEVIKNDEIKSNHNNKDNDSQLMAIEKGAELANKILSICEIREQTEAYSKEMDKKIEMVKTVADSEISKIKADTQSWETKFHQVSNFVLNAIEQISKSDNLSDNVKEKIIDTLQQTIQEFGSGNGK